MYPVNFGVTAVQSRIENLLKNGYYSEALLTTVFTYEKTIHRTLKQLIISSGFRSKDAKKLLSNIQGFKRQIEVWSCFDPQNRNLPVLLDNYHWQHIQKGIKIRNDLVHGARAYLPEKCEDMTVKVLALLNHTIKVFDEQYGYSGWERVTVRIKSKLHSDPKVKK